MFLFNFFGFLFFIAMGSEQIDAYKHAPYVSLQMLFMDGEICALILFWCEFCFFICFIFKGVAKARGMGSMAILTSFVFLVDTVFNILAMWNGQ